MDAFATRSLRMKSFETWFSFTPMQVYLSLYTTVSLMIDQAKGGVVILGDSLCIFDLKVGFLYMILNLLVELNHPFELFIYK